VHGWLRRFEDEEAKLNTSLLLSLKGFQQHQYPVVAIATLQASYPELRELAVRCSDDGCDGCWMPWAERKKLLSFDAFVTDAAMSKLKVLP
jgi:hypothetical protein